MLKHAQPKGERALLSETLIENALALTGLKLYGESIIQLIDSDGTIKYNIFSIQKFCYYLLSPEFIEKYHKRYTDYPYWDNSEDITYSRFGVAIGKYQSGNSEPLIKLLSKITH